MIPPEQSQRLAQVRLVVTDLDGTLLGPDHRTSPGNRAAVQRATAAGLQVILASGRLGTSVLPLAAELGLPGPHICGNGTYAATGTSAATMATGHLHCLPTPLADHIINAVEATGHQAILFTPSAILANAPNTDTDFLAGYGDAAFTFTGSPLPRRTDIIKILCVTAAPGTTAPGADSSPSPVAPGTSPAQAPHPTEPHLDQHFRDSFGPSVQVLRSGIRFLEFLLPGASKGSALTELMTDLGLAPHQVLALGDNDNDVSMFQVAGQSFAMEGATPAAKAAATWQAGPHEHDAVAQVLDLILAQRASANSDLLPNPHKQDCP